MSAQVSDPADARRTVPLRGTVASSTALPAIVKCGILARIGGGPTGDPDTRHGRNECHGREVIGSL